MRHASGAVIASIVVAIGTWSSAAHAQRLVGWGFSGSSNTDRAQPALKAAAGLYDSMAVLNDGRIAAWGSDSDKQVNVPVDLGAAVSVAGG
ncbi:MAG: hypothetical protein QM519_01660, partial [Bacteroidia bacterium]|nr:hypothetical protein [Bacteroidia bacterium]